MMIILNTPINQPTRLCHNGAKWFGILAGNASNYNRQTLFYWMSYSCCHIFNAWSVFFVEMCLHKQDTNQDKEKHNFIGMKWFYVGALFISVWRCSLTQICNLIFDIFSRGCCSDQLRSFANIKYNFVSYHYSIYF